MGQMPLYYFLFVFVAGFALSAVLTPVVRRLAIKTGQVAAPRAGRWHKKDTAVLGGVSIFCVTMTVWLAGAGYSGWITYGHPYLPLMACAGAVFGLGLADDIFNISPQHKLAGQIVITSVLMFFGFRLGWTDSETINLLLSILWVVGITNAFNLLDNMDGLSAGIAFIAGAFLFLFIYLNPGYSGFSGPVLLMSAAYLGAILGFLIYNFNPASIFMGDAGSLFIGFMLASLTMIGSPPQQAGRGYVNLLSVIAIPILLLFIPILDTGFVSLMRKLFHRRISQGGRDHSSHRLVAVGFSERRAVMILYVFSILSGVIALSITRLGTGVSLVIIALYLLLILFFWIYLAKVRVYPEETMASDGETGVFTPVLIKITYRRRLFEVLLDLVLITVAYYTAYLLRFEGDPGLNFDFFLRSLPIVIACQILAFYVFAVYRGVWEKTSLRDLVGYIKAITAGSIVPMLILLFAYRFYSFSRAVFVIYWGLMLILVSLSRLSFRLLDEGVRKTNPKGQPVLIYGAGLGGQMALREIETNRELGLMAVGFMDDNPGIKRRKIRGYPVFGGEEDLEKIVKKYLVKQIIVSFKEDSHKKKKVLTTLCRDMGMQVDVKEMKLVIS